MDRLWIRLFVSFAILLLLAIGGLAVLIGRATEGEFRVFIREGIALETEHFQQTLSRYYAEHGSWQGVESIVQGMGQLSGERVALLGPDGDVVADSSGEIGSVEEVRRSLRVATPIYSGERAVGTLYLMPSHLSPQGLDAQTAFLGAVDRYVALSGIAALIVALLISLWLSRRELRPVEIMIGVAKELGKGNLNRRVAVRGRSELADLASALNAMAEGLARAQQLRRNLVGDVAHELRQPLTNLRAFSEALTEGVSAPTPEVLGIIHDEVVQLGQLVDDLQDLALMDMNRLPMNRDPVALAEVANRAVAATSAVAAAKGVTLRFDALAAPVVFADRYRLDQVVRNLLQNALAATDAGGDVVVTTRQVDEEAELAICDNGHGIPEEDLPYIFERFYRVDPSRSRETGGSGLGLCIARGIVEAHGGHIRVSSRVGQGTCFKIRMPLLATVAPDLESDLTPSHAL